MLLTSYLVHHLNTQLYYKELPTFAMNKAVGRIHYLLFIELTSIYISVQDEGPRRERGSFRDGRGGGDRGGRGRGGNRMIRGSRGGGDPRGGRDNFRGDRDNFRGDRGRKRGR